MGNCCILKWQYAFKLTVIFFFFVVTPEGPCSQCLYYLGYRGAKTDYWNKKSCDEGISFGYLLFACLMYIYVCIYLVLSFTMKILAGHLRVLCFTKWSNRCCQSSNRQPYHSLMCDSSNKVFLNWKIYVFWITFFELLTIWENITY